MTDLKITFSTELRDFDRLQKAINEITKELMSVGKAADTSSSQVSKLFSSTGEISRGMGALDKAVTQMKSFKDAMDELGKTRVDLNSMTGDLGKLGEAIEKSFGGAQETILGRFKNSIGQLRQEAERAVQTQQMYEKHADRAKSMGNQNFADMYRLRAQRTAVAAGSLTTEAQRQQIAMEDAEDQIGYQGSWMASAEGQLRGYVAGALRPFSRRLARMGTSFGGVARAAGVGVGAAATAFGAVNAISEFATIRPEQIFQAEQQEQWGAMQAAAQGDPTLMALRSRGVGAEHSYNESFLQKVGAIGFGATAGNMGRLLSGQMPIVSPTLLGLQAQMRRRQVDEATFNNAYQSPTQGLYQRQSEYYNLYKTFGDKSSESMMADIYGNGVSPERARSLVAAVQGAGGATSPTLTSQRTSELYRSMYTYGMSANAVGQLAVRQASIPDASIAARQALGAGQMQTFEGANRLSDVQAAFMGTQSYRTSYGEAERIGALAGQSGQAGMPEPIAAQVGATVANAQRQLIGSQGTLMSLSLRSSLMQSGMNVMDQGVALELYRSRGSDAAAKFISSRGGMSMDKANQLISGAGQAQKNMMSNLIDPKTRQSLADQGINATNFMMSGDQNVQDMNAPDITDNLTLGSARSKVRQVGPSVDAKAFPKTAEDTRQEAAARGEADTVRYTKQIFDEIVKLVNQGLTVKSEPMEAALKKIASMQPQPSSTKAPTSDQPFGGTRGAKY